MDAEKATLPELEGQYEAAMKEAESLVFLVRDSELQTLQIETLRKLKDRIRGFKYGAEQARDEKATNRLFHFQCGLNAMISFLTMWVELKKEHYESAWGKLVDAEEYISVAMKASEAGPALEKFLDRLGETERVVFPGFRIFNSAGLIIRGGECSVCGAPFGKCPHIEGLVYWGRLCRRVNVELVSVDHVAIVDEPRDRRCIITEVSTEGGRHRDSMTWKETSIDGKTPPTDGKTFTGVIYSFESIEVD